MAHTSFFIKMLVILGIFPVAAPAETFGAEEAVAEVVAANHVGMLARAVGIWCAALWIDESAAVSLADIRIVERVDVNRQSIGMIRQFTSIRDMTKIKRTAIVIFHR